MALTHVLSLDPAVRRYGYRGPYPDRAFGVLEQCYENPVYIDSDFARANRMYVAFCASLGWISSIRPDGWDFGSRWHLTPAGLTALEDHHNPETDPHGRS